MRSRTRFEPEAPMNFTWFSIIAVIAGIGLPVTILAFAGAYLYRNRPKPEERTYFWDER